MSYEPTEEEILAEVHRRGRKNNSKWDSDIWGYEQFHQDQKDFLYVEAKERLMNPFECDGSAWCTANDHILGCFASDNPILYLSEEDLKILGKDDA